MSDARIDPATGDLDVSFGGPRMHTRGEALEAVAQRVLIRLRTLLGEWFADTNKGVPWFQQILGSKDRLLALAILRDVVAGTPGVVSVDFIDGDFDSDRLFTVTIKATSDAGPLDLSDVPIEQADTVSDPWTPLNLTSPAACEFWYDPTNAETLTLEGVDDNVEGMADLGPNGFDLVPVEGPTGIVASSDPARRPFFQPDGTISYDGNSDQNLGYPTGGDEAELTALFIVCGYSDATFLTDFRAFFSGGADAGASGLVDGDCFIGSDGLATLEPMAGGNADVMVRINGTDVGLLSTSPAVLPALVTSGICVLAFYAATAPISFPDGFVFAARPFAVGSFSGDMGGIVGVRGTMSAHIVQRVEGFLAHKHGIQNRLPFNHPYRHVAPTIDD